MGWIQRLFHKSQTAIQDDKELRFHLEQLTRDFVAEGMSEQEARRRAKLDFGGLDRVKEEIRDIRRETYIDDFARDFRCGVRNLAKNPGFTAVALLSLTLGIGANTTVFAFVKGIFLQPIPVKDPSTAIVVFATQQTADGTVLHFLQSSYENVKDYREKNDAFTGLSVFMDEPNQVDLPGLTAPIFVDVQLVNWDFFEILGVKPSIGRSFGPDEDLARDPRPVVILSHGLWNMKFSADPHILGKTIRLNEKDYRVIGVMPKQFDQAGILGSPAMWAPIAMHSELVTDMRKDFFPMRRARIGYMIGRLKPGVSLDRARASMNALGNHLVEEHPKDNAGRNVELVPLSKTNVAVGRRSVFVLVATLMMGIVGMILLIACGNVANLLLVRTIQRQRELAIRLSLGASRGRLVRQMMTESLLLGFAAALLGILCAYWMRSLVWKLLPIGAPQGYDFSLDGRVLLFTLTLSILASFLFGLVPSLRASSSRQLATLRDRTNAPSGRWYGFRGMLVTAQIAFSLIALVGAGLFIHSLRNAQRVDPGFETKHELIVALDPGRNHYPQERAEKYYRDATEKVRALPMVSGVGIANYPPFLLSMTYATFPEGVDTSDLRNTSQFPVVAVGPGYFSSAGIPVLRGRDVNIDDDAQTNRVVVINQALADYAWPGKDPIGKHLLFAGLNQNAEVIGVVATVKARTLGEPPQPLLYVALKQSYSPNAFLYVRTKGDPSVAVPAVREAVRAVDPATPPIWEIGVASFLDQNFTAPRFAAELLAGFGALALLLAAIGTCGVMSYSVSQRTQEIGIRMALGAQRVDVLRLILSNGMTWVVAGVLIGLGASVFFTRSINKLLFGIGSFDAGSFFAAAALLIGVALVACWLPARRAMRVDPVIALRCE